MEQKATTALVPADRAELPPDSTKVSGYPGTYTIAGADIAGVAIFDDGGS